MYVFVLKPEQIDVWNVQGFNGEKRESTTNFLAKTGSKNYSLVDLVLYKKSLAQAKQSTEKLGRATVGMGLAKNIWVCGFPRDDG